MELVTVPVAARELAVSARRIRQAIREGELSAYRMGLRWNRVDRSEVKRWVDSKKVVSAAERGRQRARRV